MHQLFYFPYASLTDQQLPLLKVAALYFDELTILDPLGASWDTIGADPVARDALKLLAEETAILKVVKPSDVLAKYGDPICEAIRRDMADRGFLDLCDEHAVETGKQRWTLSLAKVPKRLATDKAMQKLMGDFAREVSQESGLFREQSGANPQEYYEYAEGGRAYDELRDGYEGQIEYRYADFPLALGEAIMLNHALFGALLHAEATPITDDAFHDRALALKLKRAMQEPKIRDALASRAAERNLKAGMLAASALTDTQIELPILDPSIPLHEVLEYRQSNGDALAECRRKLSHMARRIHAEPWSADFARELETETMPDLIAELAEAAKARDAWVRSMTKKTWLKVAGFTVAAASAVLAVAAAPVTPIALAAAGLGIASGTVIPGAEWLIEWRDGKKTLQENGLRYLLKV